MICCLLCPCYCPTRSRLICWPGHCAQSREAGGAPSTRSGASDAKESCVHTYDGCTTCMQSCPGRYILHTYIHMYPPRASHNCQKRASESRGCNMHRKIRIGESSRRMLFGLLVIWVRAHLRVRQRSATYIQLFVCTYACHCTSKRVTLRTLSGDF